MLIFITHLIFLKLMIPEIKSYLLTVAQLYLQPQISYYLSPLIHNLIAKSGYYLRWTHRTRCVQSFTLKPLTMFLLHISSCNIICNAITEDVTHCIFPSNIHASFPSNNRQLSFSPTLQLHFYDSVYCCWSQQYIVELW